MQFDSNFSHIDILLLAICWLVEFGAHNSELSWMDFAKAVQYQPIHNCRRIWYTEPSSDTKDICNFLQNFHRFFLKHSLKGTLLCCSDTGSNNTNFNYDYRKNEGVKKKISFYQYCIFNCNICSYCCSDRLLHKEKNSQANKQSPWKLQQSGQSKRGFSSTILSLRPTTYVGEWTLLHHTWK